MFLKAIGRSVRDLRGIPSQMRTAIERIESIERLCTVNQQEAQDAIGTCQDGIIQLQQQLAPLNEKVADSPVEHRFYGQFSPPVDQFMFERYFRNTDIEGILVECGAFDGVTESSCKFFEESMGWKAYNIEPMPAAFEKLCCNRPDSTNLNLALSDKVGQSSFKVVRHPELGFGFGNSSLSHTPAHLQLLAETGCSFTDVDVSITTWCDLIEQHSIPYVDVFVLDVEGHEMAVLDGMQGCPVLPDLICIEIAHLDFTAIRMRLAKLGYVYDISLHVNGYFIHESKLSLFALRSTSR